MKRHEKQYVSTPFLEHHKMCVLVHLHNGGISVKYCLTLGIIRALIKVKKHL